MITVIVLVIGAALAFGFLTLTRAQWDGGMRFYAIGLLVTALLYVVFALIGRAGSQGLLVEALGVALYGGAAWIGRRSSTVLAIGWALHPVWDVWLHARGAGAAYTPGWYPMGCVSFDLMVAGAVLVTRRSSSRVTTSRQA